MHHTTLSRAAEASIQQPHTPLTRLLLLMMMVMRKRLVMRMQSRSRQERLLSAC